MFRQILVDTNDRIGVCRVSPIEPLQKFRLLIVAYGITSSTYILIGGNHTLEGGSREQQQQLISLLSLSFDGNNGDNVLF